MQSETDAARGRMARYELAALILSLAVGVGAYHWLVYEELEQTAALFIGLPATVAACLALVPPGPSGLGRVVRGTGILVFASGPLLGEGFLCVLMALPLFSLVIGIGFVLFGLCGSLARSFARRSKPRRRDLLALGAPLLVLASLEGVGEPLSFARSERIHVRASVEGSPEAVVARLERTPSCELELPFFLRLGFPRPQRARGAGLEIGDERRVLFAGGEGEAGELVLRVQERTPGRVLFEAVSDASHIAHWLSWRRIEFAWTPLPGERTRVSCTLHYERELDPAWYFGPWERYAVRLVGELLIQQLCAAREG